ncbi:hypothetical protein ACFLWU_06165 [Chloroflexota bacterium]
MTFYDTLISPVTRTLPENKASGIGSIIDHTIKNVSIDWETPEGATSYQWQLDYDTDFSSVPDGFKSNTKASSAHLPTLEPATTYYWRVRASAPVLSPWSDKWSFTTSLDTETFSLNLENPKVGDSTVPIKPVFQWSAITGADTYELLVSNEVNFTSPLIIKKDDYALPATAWECDVNLDYATTYYWKVRAISATTRSNWSAVGAFTTKSTPAPLPETPPAKPASIPMVKFPEPEPATTLTPLTNPPAPVMPPAQTPPPPPTFIQSQSIPGWVIYLIGGLFLTIILTLIIILTLVLCLRR